MNTILKTHQWVSVLSLFAITACGQSPEPGTGDNDKDPSAQEPSGKDTGGSKSDEKGDGSGEASSSTGGEQETSSAPEDDSSDKGKDKTSSEKESTTSTSEESSEPEDGKINCNELKVTGTNIGDVPPNVELVNAKGKKVSLHEYCNDVLYLVAATSY